MLYEVTISRTGTVQVAAENPSEALAYANGLDASDVTWDSDWAATDAQELDKADACVGTYC